jgi:TPR repeat protein
MYFLGKGVPVDYTEAEYWLTMGAKRGNAEAQATLGIAYLHSLEHKKDLSKAVKLLQPAATKDHSPTAQSILGQIYLGFYCKQMVNITKAYQWLSKAAMGGDADAQLYLSLMYADGVGIEKNKAKAAYWRQKAFAQPVVNLNSTSKWVKSKMASGATVYLAAKYGGGGVYSLKGLASNKR